MSSTYTSFGLGVVSGMVVLGIAVGGLHLFSPRAQAGLRGGFQQGQGGGMNAAFMAQRMGISEADLQKELDSGKTMQQIATEHGVTFGRGGNKPGTGSGAQRPTGSGAAMIPSSEASSISSAH